jgi:hypothetical protein
MAGGLTMTEYHFRTLLICVNKGAGNGLANIAASFPNDPAAELGTFDDSRMVALSSDPTTPVAWYAEIPSKHTMAGVIEALKDGASYDDDRLSYLRERGMTAEQWALADAVLPIRDVYDTLEGGYRPDAMTELAAAHGYVIVEAE